VADTSQAITLPGEGGLLSRLRRRFTDEPDRAAEPGEEPPT
jgi:hypothetical protein